MNCVYLHNEDFSPTDGWISKALYWTNEAIHKRFLLCDIIYIKVNVIYIDGKQIRGFPGRAGGGG